MNGTNNRYPMALAVFLASTSAPTIHAAMLEEVVVTAQKRSESVQDIPVAVTGMSADSLEQFGFEDAGDISAQVPNMQSSGPYGDVQPIFSIRGVSMSDYNSNQASPVGVYVDEAYLGAVYTHGMNFFDVERIEVLRGPQGTLYGKNTTGGAINIITRTPDIDGPLTGNIALGTGSYGERSASGAIEGTLIDGSLAARAAFNYKKDDGYFDNKLGGDDMAQTDYRAGRIALNWQASDNFSAVLKYTAGKSDPIATPPRGEGRIPVSGLGDVDITGYQRPSSFDAYEGEINKVGHTNVDINQTTLRMTYEGEAYTVVSVSSWYDAEYFQAADTDGGPTRNLEIDWQSSTEAISQDLRLVSQFDGMFNFIAGIYYGKEKLDMHNLLTLYASPTIFAGSATGDLLAQYGTFDQRQDTEKESVAGYSQFGWDITDRLGLDIGVRYTRDENELTYINSSRLDLEGNPLGSWVPGNITGTLVDAPFIPPESDPAGVGFYISGPYTTASGPTFDKTENEWTGKISVDYAFSDSLMTYLSYSRGYRSGSFNSGTYYTPRMHVDDIYASPEFVNTWEAGFKSDLLDQRLRINAAAFFYDYKDQQFINVVGVSSNLQNAGSSEIYGLELELWARPSENLTIQAAIGWLETEFNTLELGDSVNGGTIDLSGNELISAPKLNFSLAADYDIRLSDWGSLRAHVDTSYQDDQWFSAYNDDIGYGHIQQDGYWLLNSRLSLLFGEAENYTLAIWGKNLADEEYDSYAINLQSGFGYDYFLAGAPRTYGIEFSYNF
ncbi:TonB-dependent receptor [Parahaliea mediterranea]|uniref:TonB-dependent receptor n=1 Tax=Parahaliea mediterranea TaxID=651086 RepID=UPI000E2EC3B7|nr:TonB-dependent receptor [Parahaliea mediterranea]